MTLDLADRQRRWTPKRKAALLADIDAGQIEPGTLELLGLSQEELMTWRRDFSGHGVLGLQVCSLHYRYPERRKAAIHRHHSHRKPGRIDF
jgi:Protein of unknown function (DUF1153)